MANCHTCKEQIRYGYKNCPNCGIKLDYEDLFSSTVNNFILTQAISSANTLKGADAAVPIMIGVSLLRFTISYPLWFQILLSLGWLVPLVQLVRWHFKHGRWNLTDAEYKQAKYEMKTSLRLWIAANIFNAVLIIGGDMWGHKWWLN